MTRLDRFVGNSGTLEYSDMKTAVLVFEFACNLVISAAFQHIDSKYCSSVITFF